MKQHDKTSGQKEIGVENNQSCKDNTQKAYSSPEGHIIERLARIEMGQQMLCKGMTDLNKAIAKISVQEERQITFGNRLDAVWIKVDTLQHQHDKCPIENLKTQVGWIWVFLSSLALGLTMLFLNMMVLK